MKNLMPNNHYLKTLISNYLRAKLQSLDNFKKIQQILYNDQIDRLNITSIYHLINKYDDRLKFKNNIKLIDQQLQLNYNRQDRQFQSGNGVNFNLVMSVERLKVFVRYNLPYEQIIEEILEHVLIDQCLPSDIVLLASLLTVKSVYYSKKYMKLIQNIFDLIEEGLQNYPSSNLVLSILKFTSKSEFTLPQKLQVTLKRMLDEYINYYDYQDLSVVFNYIFQKSVKQFSMFGMTESNGFKKRIIYQLMMKKMGGRDRDGDLPGKEWTNSVQLQEAMKCIRSIGIKEPFLDIFPKVQIEKQKEIVMKLKHPQFFKYYFENIFTFFRISHKKIDKSSLQSILQILTHFFNQKQRFFPLQLTKLTQKHEINLIKLYIILSQCLKHVNYNETSLLKPQLTQYLSLVSSYLTTQYLQNHNFLQYNFSDLSFLYQFIYNQLVMNLNEVNLMENQRGLVFWDMNRIQLILKLQKQKKYIQSQYNSLLAFFRFIKVAIQRKSNKKQEMKVIGMNHVLAFEIVKLQELNEIIDRRNESNNGLNEINFTAQQLQKVSKSYDIYKHVILQPNLQFSYLIALKQTKSILLVFENKVGLANISTYCEDSIKQRKNIQNEQRELTVYSSWKKQFLKSYYNAQYVFCESDKQFQFKFCQKLKILLDELKQK